MPANLGALLKYSEDQPRDERGRWTDGGAAETITKGDRPGHPFRGNQYVSAEGGSAEADDVNRELPFGRTGEAVRRPALVPDPLFHGTSDQAMTGILREGLKPRGGPGADDWAKANNFHHEELMGREHAGKSVFLSYDPVESRKYANLAAEMTGGKPIMLVVDVPKAEKRNFHRDWNGDTTGIVAERSIPPEWIRPYHFELTPDNLYSIKLRNKVGGRLTEDERGALARELQRELEEAKPISMQDLLGMLGVRVVGKADLDTEPLLAIILVDGEVTKGDFVGHPFRGNQYTDNALTDTDFPADDAVAEVNATLESSFGIGGPKLLGFKALRADLYHGSAESFTHIIESRLNNAHVQQMGEPIMFLTPSPALASTYGKEINRFHVETGRAMVIDMNGRDWQESISAVQEIMLHPNLGSYNAFVFRNVQDFGPHPYRGGPAAHTVVGLRSPAQFARRVIEKYDENQPRDELGRWADTGAEPKQTLRGYHLFNTRNGQLYATQIGKGKPFPVGVWVQAKNIPTKGFKRRPGYHSSDLPLAPQMRVPAAPHPDRNIDPDRVWAEVEIPADVDWQPKANASPTRDLPDQIPVGGHYRYRPNKDTEWRISGSMRAIRILSDAEVHQILTAAGRPEDAIRETTRRPRIKRKVDLGTLLKYREDQARDERGRWMVEGGAAGAPQPEGTEKFDRWARGAPLREIGKGDVVRTGQPIVLQMVHGSPNAGSLRAFDSSMIGSGMFGSARNNDLGWHFTDDRLTAAGYALGIDVESEGHLTAAAERQLNTVMGGGVTEAGEGVIDAYVRLDNPLVMLGDQYTYYIEGKQKDVDFLRQYMKDNGHDGIVVMWTGKAAMPAGREAFQQAYDASVDAMTAKFNALTPAEQEEVGRIDADFLSWSMSRDPTSAFPTEARELYTRLMGRDIFEGLPEPQAKHYGNEIKLSDDEVVRYSRAIEGRVSDDTVEMYRNLPIGVSAAVSARKLGDDNIWVVVAPEAADRGQIKDAGSTEFSDSPEIRKVDLGSVLKYSEDQPRAPAGTGEGGQWVAAGADAPATIDADLFEDSAKYGGNSRAEVLADRMTEVFANTNPHDQGYLRPGNLKIQVGNNLQEALRHDAAWQKVAGPWDTQRGTLGGDRTLVDKFIKQWATTSSDHDPISLLLQEAATLEFGLKDSVVSATARAAAGMDTTLYQLASVTENDGSPRPATIEKLGERVLARLFPMPQQRAGLTPNDMVAAARSFLRSMYDATQFDLRANGIKELVVFRGVENRTGYLQPRRADLKMHAMSSFASELFTAAGFAGGGRGMVIVTRVPASRVLSTPRTGFGCLDENEVVVLGGKTEGYVLPERKWTYGWSNHVYEGLKADPPVRKDAPQVIDIDALLSDADWPKRTNDVANSDRMQKGDYTGHPFRGNQYVSGDMGGAEVADSIIGRLGAALGYTEIERGWVRDLIRQTAEGQRNGTLPRGVRADAKLDAPKQSVDDIKAYLRLSHPASSQAFVLKYGKEHPTPAAPPPVNLMTPKMCFENACKQSEVFFGEYRYAEGYVKIPGVPIMIEHAWNLNKHGEVVDFTLGWNPKAAYFGVEVPPDELRREITRSRTYGALQKDDGPSQLVREWLAREDPK